MIKRILENKIKSNFFKWKIIILIWARQIWKTTLIENILSKSFKKNNTITFNWDYINDRELLNNNSLSKLELFTKDSDIIFIDEAQKIMNIGNTLKILIDKYKNKKQIIVTWSSSINILDLTSEPLTWRKIVYTMYGISSLEFKNTYWIKKLDENLENLIIYWSYPSVLNTNSLNEKITTLKELANSSLYRDILEFQQIKNSDVIMKLLKLLALQIWSEVSICELANNLWIDTKTVNRYIDLLQKSYIIFKLPPLFKNKRKELKKLNKIYFYDLWIRNMILNNMTKPENRTDIWWLWENFLIIERMKKNTYSDKYLNKYFWRNYNKQEIDYIEEYDGKIHAFEFKWWNKNSKIPKSFSKNYTNSEFMTINNNNYLDFVL